MLFEEVQPHSTEARPSGRFEQIEQETRLLLAKHRRVIDTDPALKSIQVVIKIKPDRLKVIAILQNGNRRALTNELS